MHKKQHIEIGSQGFDIPEDMIEENDSIIRKENFMIKDALGDGSYFFGAFLIGMGSDENKYNDLKEILIQHIKMDRDKYVEPIYLSEELVPEEYINHINEDGAWGGAVELNLLLNHFGRRIVI